MSLPIELMEIICIEVLRQYKNSETVKNFSMSCKTNYALVERNIKHDNIGKFLSWHNDTCYYCHNPKRNSREFYGRKIYVCFNCSRPRFTVLSTNQAKKLYGLSDEMLRVIPKKKIFHPRSVRSFITYYLDEDLAREYIKFKLI